MTGSWKIWRRNLGRSNWNKEPQMVHWLSISSWIHIRSNKCTSAFQRIY